VARPPAVSPFLTGDPIRLVADVTTVADVARAVGLAEPEATAALPLADRAVLIHSLTEPVGSISLRWVHLPHAPALTGAGPAEVAVVLTAPIRESGRALRLVSRLSACLRDPQVIGRARSVSTREALASLLAAAEQRAGESPIASENVLALLSSTLTGLGGGEVSRRQAACGPNRIERISRRPLAARFLEQFTSFFAVLLWIGAGFAFLASLPELGWAILAVIVINGVFSFLQEYRAERAVEALQRLLPQQITVVRDGLEVRVPAEDLVPGDVVRVEEGDQIPADGQLLTGDGLRVDQSPLTGESQPVFKLPPIADERESVPHEERHELVFAGTGVVAGSGVFVARATGMATEIGAIAQLTQTVAEEPSPLQREMRGVTRVVTALAVSFGVGFFALAVAAGVLPLHEGFLFALGVIVANVPEGLLPTLSLALAIGAQRLARQGSLVKRLSAVETLGATTVICTDKTGTLTENRMTARFFWVSGRPVAAADVIPTAAAGVRELLEAGVLASQATTERGDPTEKAIVAAAGAAGIDADEIRRAHRLLAPYPFDSFRKRMTLVRASADGARAWVKGAPKETLGLCERLRWDGRDVQLTDEMREAIVADHDRLAADGLRILAVAVRRLSSDRIGGPAAAVERELTFLGLIALWDPPRPEVEGAVAVCRRAGIRVVMITGDYGLTARAIARQIGLPVTKVVTGDEVERMSAEALGELLAEPGVLFARTSPAHKLRIVGKLRQAGEVVAVTGDGVNDAPALKAADIGVAMGQRGSEVAKEAAEMVVTDDNFASIVTAIREGRAIYANMGKFVTYIFASNVPELVPFLAMVFLGIPLPLTVMQILAVDLGTDMLPALSLGAEAPEPDVMDRPPRPRQQRLLGWKRLLHAYGFLGVAEAALALLAFFWTYRTAGWRPGMPMDGGGGLYRRATTMTLAGIVAAQVGNVFACRTDRESVFRVGFLENRFLLWSIAAEIGILLILIFVPPFPTVFGLAPLAFDEWRILIAFPVVMIALEECRKCIVRRVPTAPVGRLIEGRIAA
jgi:calcium-translocating P-type ATPase